MEDIRWLFAGLIFSPKILNCEILIIVLCWIKIEATMRLDVFCTIILPVTAAISSKGSRVASALEDLLFVAGFIFYAEACDGR